MLMNSVGQKFGGVIAGMECSASQSSALSLKTL